MAATDRAEPGGAAQELAATVTSSSFVKLRVAPSVDALVASGILAAALTERDIPFQSRIADTVTDARALHLGTHAETVADELVPPGTVTETTVQLVAQLGEPPTGKLVSTAGVLGTVETDADREAGIGVPIADYIDGLAHTTLVHGPYSGDPERAQQLVGDREDVDPTELASLVTLETIDASVPRAGHAVERILHPVQTPDGPFASAAGMADVLDVLSEIDPGLALALVHGHHDSREAALGSWRREATAVHAACADVTADEHPVTVVRADVRAPGVLARLVRDYRVDTPAVLVVGADGIGVASATGDGRELADAIDDQCDAIVVRQDRRVTASRPTQIDAVEHAITEVHQ